MRAGMEKGADDYLVKPFTRDELIAAINAQWNKHKLIEERVQKKVDEVGRNVTYALPHEFRTALNEIIGSAKFLSNIDEISKDEIKEIANDIIFSANRLLKITENFLIFVSIESFAMNPEKKRLLRTFITEEPFALVNDVANVIASKYKRFQDLDINYDENLDDIKLEISTENFNKLFEELLDNAFRFSESNSKVIVKFWVDNNEMFCQIQDFGRGMSAEQIKNIAALTQFDRTIYEQQGVGLGLIIAKKLVEIHDGRFEIHSKENEGTTILFSLNLSQ